ncbi:hypothetical protein RJ640_009214 [Escallonia rubra]|uniref:Homeobox domain-containing protein n=1 Tax=Escallonia rubra TaxID=112253 RepID=A0AA88QJZ5_9ASTE|nr:hypothetical protein RJ640_009212 [Escallonia rubra]KAK2974932.1 hypothetical protein RJ640_009214 [Escallonia rubra]
MENDLFSVPIGIASQNPNVMNEIFSHATLGSTAESNSIDLNNQMARFPVLSMLQGEPINDLHGGLHLANRAGNATSDARIPRNLHLERNATIDSSIGSSFPVSNTEVQYRFMAGMPISAASIATLLAARLGPYENVNDISTSAPAAHPGNVLKPFDSSDYSDTPRSSLGISGNSGYDGMIGHMSSKWDLDSLLPSLDLSGTVPGRTEFGPLRLMENMNPNGWISSESATVSSSCPSGSSRFSNELSLSLAMCQPAVICGTTIPDQCSEISYCGLSSHSLQERRFQPEQTSCNNRNLSSSFGSLKAVQVSQLLTGSGYLHVMQEILAEVDAYSLENLDHTNYPASRIGAGANIPFPSRRDDGICTEIGSDDFQIGPLLRGREVETKKKHLLALLQAVDDRYSQCLDEIHTVVSAFHAVTELDPHRHARFALQTLSYLYKNLRGRISNHILAMGVQLNGGTREEEKSFETSFIQKQWALQQLRRKDHQLWRPQRGLPEQSVSVLRAWMFQNFLHPYPKDAEKHLLAIKSGLSRSQVSNWFINARVRLWKPMIEEMYAEMNRRKGRQDDEDTDSNPRKHISIEGQQFRMI